MTALMYEISEEEEHNYYLNYDERDDMGSLNHSLIQLKLGSLLLSEGGYSVATELSIDISSVHDQFENLPVTYIADIAMYPRLQMNRHQDIVRMAEAPLLVVEILSPMQPTQTLIDKLAVYFALGVKSCWLVYPHSQTVDVYDAPYQSRLFSSGDGDIVDEIMSIRLPIDEIFR